VTAVLMLLIALLHTTLAVRSSNWHLESYQFGEAKQHVNRVGEALNLVRTPDERNRQLAVYVKVL
jgi:hypothetical protein